MTETTRRPHGRPLVRQPLLAILLVTVTVVLAAPSSGPDAARQERLSRGRYLTERVAMCIQCHSPRDDQGNLLLEQKFTGAPMPVTGPTWATDWAYRTPALLDMNLYTRDEAIRLLTTGIARTGEPPAPPMPPFRFTREDAEAIYEYLTRLTE